MVSGCFYNVYPIFYMHSDRDGRVGCTLYGVECESVVHVLWECFSYSTCRDNFQEVL